MKNRCCYFVTLLHIAANVHMFCLIVNYYVPLPPNSILLSYENIFLLHGLRPFPVGGNLRRNRRNCSPRRRLAVNNR